MNSRAYTFRILNIAPFSSAATPDWIQVPLPRQRAVSASRNPPIWKAAQSRSIVTSGNKYHLLRDWQSLFRRGIGFPINRNIDGSRQDVARESTAAAPISSYDEGRPECALVLVVRWPTVDADSSVATESLNSNHVSDPLSHVNRQDADHTHTLFAPPEAVLHSGPHSPFLPNAE